MQKENPLLPHHSAFTAITTKTHEYPIIAFDTEDDTKGTVTLFAFYGDFPGGQFVTRHADEAMEFIYSIEEPTIFVAHNLEYDIANLCKHDNYLMVENMVYASRLLRVDFAGTKHFFLNSLSFFAGSLAQMGKFVGLEKMDGNAFSNEYVTRDAEICYTFTKKFQSKLVNELDINLGVSIGKMSMDAYRRHHMESNRQVTYNSPNCLKAYYGGRVEIFKKGLTKNIKVSDINSSYPNVMRNREYPDTSRIEPSSIHTHRFGIGRFKVYVPENTFLPVLPFKSDSGKLFFPVGEFTGWWTYAEVRHAIEHGAKILKEYEGEGTNTGIYPFTDFIDTYYSLRLKSKERVQKSKESGIEDPEAKFDDLFYKLWLNNLYGKWCQHKAGSSMTRDRWPGYKIDKYIDNPEFKEAKVGPFFSYTVPKEEPPLTANFMWGVYVTSYARIDLHKGLYNIYESGNTPLYCDTDSVMYEPKNSHVPFSLSNKLGDWDCESFDLGVFMQSKGYLLCKLEDDSTYTIQKVACKGVPSHYAYDFIIEGMARFQKPMRLKEALIRSSAVANKDKDLFLEEIGENIWSDVEKEMRAIYIKRLGDDVTYPVPANKIRELEDTQEKYKSKNAKELLKDNNLIINKPNPKAKFNIIPIPDGWFNRDNKNKPEPKPDNFNAHKILQLRTEQLLELKKGQIWFSGHIISKSKVKNKYELKILITKFKNKKINFIFWGKISEKFLKNFGLYGNIINKKIDVSLFNIYNCESKFPNLKIKMYDSELKVPLTNIPDDDSDELSESELQELMALKWDNIICHQSNS
jgi:hypothetical protein